jgi:hypothetical protein
MLAIMACSLGPGMQGKWRAIAATGKKILCLRAFTSGFRLPTMQ